MNKCLAFVLIAMIAVNGILAAPRSDDEEKEVESSTKEATCSPWLGYCQLYEHCCRDLMCAGYLLKCVPIGGIRPPGKDTRPIGPPPYYPRPRGFEGDDDTSEDKSE